jgi:hypothetical protein
MYVLTILLLLPALLFIYMAKRGKELYIRRIPGIDAIEEAIGRATELGKPMMFTTGLTRISALLFALLGILRHIAGKAAAYGCRLIVPQCDYEVMPICEETVREAFRAAGRLDRFNPRDIRFLSTDQFAFASGYMGIAHREGAASCFLFGHFAAESLILAEAGQQIGAMQVAGTATNTQVPFFLTSCDYTIIGEEVFAAGAYLSREPAQLGSVRGQDVSKLVILTVIFLGVVSATWTSFRHRDTLEAKELNNPFARAIYAKPGQKRVLARFELADSYKPQPAPGEADLEEGLSSARRKIGYNARLVGGEIGGTAGRIAELGEALRAVGSRFPPGEGAAEAARVAAELGEIAGRAGEVSGELKKLVGERLPGLEKVRAGKARQRAVELRSPELEALSYWVKSQKEPPKRCEALVRNAQGTLESAGSTPAAIERDVRAARRACCRAHFAELRGQIGAAELAAEKPEPEFFLRTKASKLGGEATPLMLQGGESVSGRGTPLPLSYEWRVLSMPDRAEVFKGRGRVSRVTFPKPGRYRVDLSITEQLPGRLMILGVDGAVPTKVEHRTVTTGSKFRLTWRPAKDAAPESCQVRYETKGLGAGSTFSQAGERVLDFDGKQWDPLKERNDKEKFHPFEVTFPEPGGYVTTITAEYALKPAGDRAAERRRQAAAAAASAAPEVAAVRSRVAVGLTDVIESFNRMSKRLGIMESGAAGYGRMLGGDRGKTLTDESWPDRKAVAELHKYVSDLRAWLTASSIFVARVRAQADLLGSGKMDLPAAKEEEKEEKKEAAGPSAAEEKKPAGPEVTSNSEKYVAEGAELVHKLTATGKAPITFRVEDLPAGLSFDGKDTISGKLTSAGPHAMAVVARGADGLETRAALTVGWQRPGGWKRYRIYWHVVEPLRDSTAKNIEVKEAPERPRAPWLKPPAEKGAGEGGER